MWVGRFWFTHLQSVFCIQGAQDHSKPLKSKGRRQHQDQPRVDATEHTPRLLGLKPRNHKRQDIVVNSDVSENHFVFLFQKAERKGMGRGLGLFRNNMFLKARRQAKAPTADEQTSGEMSPVEEYLYLHVYDM